jgi:hypothetical protein
MFEIFNVLVFFLGPHQNQAVMPSIQHHLAVLAGNEMVPAGSTSSSSSSSSAGT